MPEPGLKPSSHATADSRVIPASQTAIVLVAHGERGGVQKNASLAAHVGAIECDRTFRFVGGGVLNGEPELQTALAAAKASGAQRILVYPMFMASGYFVDVKIPEELRNAGCDDICEVMSPLGSDTDLPAVMLARAVGVARKANLSPALTRLLVVGHGSQRGAPDSLRATQKFAALVRGRGVFKQVDIALLEEEPFVRDVLKVSQLPTVAVGYFYAPGLHAAEDVPKAISETGADALYTGSVGENSATTELICSAILGAAAEPVSESSSVAKATGQKSSSGGLKRFFLGLFGIKTT